MGLKLTPSGDFLRYFSSILSLLLCNFQIPYYFSFFYSSQKGRKFSPLIDIGKKEKTCVGGHEGCPRLFMYYKHKKSHLMIFSYVLFLVEKK
jgi:hypothetical protein